MSDEAKHVVIAPRAASLSVLPNDWQDQVRQIAGVDVLGAAFGRMQVRATPQALEAARRKLGHLLNFEESLPRSFPD